MEIVLSVVLLVLVILFYLSNPHNKINKWCSIAGFIFWLGAAKEAVLYQIIPLMRNSEALQTAFMPAYSVCTWALYSLAMPTTLVFALYFCDLDKTQPQRLRLLKILLYIPALIFSFFFPPLEFRAYQLSSLAFWITYSVYNLGSVAVFAVLMVRGVKSEKPGKSMQQKRRVRMVVSPPVIFWAASVFLTHPFQIQSLFKLWEVNAIFLLVGVIIFIVMAFRDGFMGLKLSGKTYNWNTNMSLINTGAEYTGHMLKNQASKMELCIEQLNSRFVEESEAPPEELAILSRSITTLKNYVDKIKRHTQDIRLFEELCDLNSLLEDAMPFSPDGQSGITVSTDISESVFLTCDKSHMTEVFSNIITNAAEAIRGEGIIEITGTYAKYFYLLCFKDNGVGMSDDTLRSMFTPYFTTKSTEKNFGLGLAYCKNVIIKHGGSISAKSKPGKGTAVTVALPLKRVCVPGEETEARDG